MATTITKDTKQITFAGSPQFVTINDAYIPAPADIFFIDINIWTGEKSAIPVQHTVSLSLPAILLYQDETGYNTECTFEISKFLAEYINSDEYISSTGSNYNDSGAVWYNFIASASGSGGGNIPITSDTKLATNGVGRIEEGSNPGTTVSDEDGKVFGNHSRKLITDPNGNYLIPVYVGDTSFNRSIVTKTQTILLTSLGFTVNSDESTEQIAYVPINSTTFGSDWGEGKEIRYLVGVGTGSPLYGISFNGVDSYMNLGVVPMLNSADSVFNANFVGFNWDNMNVPFGYNNNLSVADDRFYLIRNNANEEGYNLQAATQTTVTPTDYPNPNDYQEFMVSVFDYPTPWTLQVDIGGVTIGEMQDIEYTPRGLSGIPFYIGARNNNGVTDAYTASVFTEVEFYNGTETKIFNDSNNWNGALNYGGVRVLSQDGGLSWANVDEDSYLIKIDCTKGSPSVMKFVNFNGVIDTLPINGIGKESISIKKTNYQNSVLDTSYNYNPLSHIDKTFTSNGKTRFDVSTGWIYEDSNQMVEELLLSKLVWLETESETYPVQINTKSLQKINRTWSRQVDYSFSMTSATPIINNIL